MRRRVQRLPNPVAHLVADTLPDHFKSDDFAIDKTYRVADHKCTDYIADHPITD